jgi:hypothetical protein
VKEENTVCRKLNVSVWLDGQKITEIFFDLYHIRYGWDKEKKDYKRGTPRNNFKDYEVVAFFEQLRNVEETDLFAQNVTLTTVYKRYVFFVYDEKKKYKLVVDLMKNMMTVVVTIY